MDELAQRLESAVDLLTTVERSVPALEVPAGAFGATGIGLPGRIGTREAIRTPWPSRSPARKSPASCAPAATR
jgi:hypothetical protein